jgi:hypothetical protein
MSFLRNKPEHQWVEESLSAYIDDELTARERARVEKHLEECQACADQLASLRQTVALINELPPLRAPRSFAVRPAAVRAKPSPVPPAWGYGLLKGATALAALLLLLLIGGDLALQVVGVSSLASWAPAAPAPEVAFAPSLEPSAIPAPAEEAPLLGQTKGTEEAQAPGPENAEEVAPAAPAPTEAAQDIAVAQATASPGQTEGGIVPAGTPTAAPTSAAPPTAEAEGVGAGGAETPSAAPVAPAPTEIASEEVQPTAQPAPPSATPPGEAQQRAAVAEPAETPQMLALTEGQERAEEETAPRAAMAESLPWSPLRLAEWIALGLLVVLVPATAITGWLRRRAGR